MEDEGRKRARFQRMVDAVLGTVVGGLVLAVLGAYAGLLWASIQDIRKTNAGLAEANQRLADHFEENYPKGMAVVTGEIAALKERIAALERTLSGQGKAIDSIQGQLGAPETSTPKVYSKVAVPRVPTVAPAETAKFKEEILRKIPFESTTRRRRATIDTSARRKGFRAQKGEVRP